MNPVQKAVWFIESHFAQVLDLDEIADAGGISRFHMSRAFVVATGLPVIGYLRARRLTEAARTLADGAPDILSVALEAGYGSHEAFTRAFRDQFGITPEQVRAARDLEPLSLVEPLMLDSSPRTDLAPPRIEQGRALLIAGLAGHYGCEGPGGIPAQWQRFNEHVGHIPGQIGDVAYGLCLNSDELGNFDYVSGVEVADFSDLPEGFVSARVPAHLYAVFRHAEHISTIRQTMHAIYTEWLPNSDYEAADAPFFERYGPEFDPRTGEGGLEAWIPVTKKG
ncbi:AraC family transcriptional regulator [Caulobacter sp. Root655]|uniref:AraC family transcriptional regulator n=1 Tax=Caulobacter sp. Root655 TaxID=1736578 RepID=UPI0006F5E5A9|nr:AraC family transcriptional regulator [Caulobacter sp. Root655]KRA59357.1 AraC family transcriptional regulator [Caulobacter sp. Root655]